MRWGLRLIAKIVLTLTGFAAVGVLESAPLSLIWPIAVVAALMLTFVSTLIHELAHAAAAGWLGADINKIVVLPFEFSLGQRRLRLVGRAGKGDLGGYVAYKLDRIAPRRKHAIIAVSGPVANLVTGLAAGWMAQSVSIANAAISAGDYRLSAAPLAMAFAMLSVGMGIGNLIPFDQSDGMRIWRYFRPVAR